MSVKVHGDGTPTNPISGHAFEPMRLDAECCKWCGFMVEQHASEQPAASAAREDMAQDSGEDMARLYREAFAQTGDPSLATVSAVNQWMWGRR